MTRIEHVPGRTWVVARTKARCEKKLAEYCAHRRIPHYLPLRRSVRRYSRRTVEFLVPLFSGYVFVQIPPVDKGIIEESRHVAHTIVPDGPMEEVLIRELNDLLILEQATLEGDLVVRPEIEVGKPVIIRTGPLTGMHGIVDRRKNLARISVNIEMIGQSVSVEVDVGEVEMDF